MTYMEQAPINTFSIPKLIEGIRCPLPIAHEPVHDVDSMLLVLFPV